MSSLIVLLCIINIFQEIEIPIQYIDDYLQKENNTTGRLLEERRVSLRKKIRLLTINVSIGTPPQPFELKLSSLFQGVFIVDFKTDSAHGFNSELSSSYKSRESKTISYGTGTLSTDIFTLTDGETIYNFPFMLFSEPKFRHNERYSGILGLAYDLEEKYQESKEGMYDFFSFFKNTSGQHRKLIGIKSDKDEGIMYIGDYPIEIKNNKKIYKTCPLTTPKKNHSWRCNLNAIYFEDNDLIQLDTPADFIIGGNIIGVNQNTFYTIKDKLFSTAIMNNLCHIDKDDEIYIQIVCKSEFDKSSLGVISLVFGKWTFKLETKHLFYELEGNQYFILLTEKFDLDHWYVPPSMLFGIYIFFDKDNNELGFYRSKK